MITTIAKPRHRNYRLEDARPQVVCQGALHTASRGTACPACTPDLYSVAAAKHRMPGLWPAGTDEVPA